jgi:hypothetical protein
MTHSYFTVRQQTRNAELFRVESKGLIFIFFPGGADRDRTDDLLNAIRNKEILQVIENTTKNLINNNLNRIFIYI